MNFTPVFGWYYITANDRTPSWTGVNELYAFLTRGGAGPKGRAVPLADIRIGDIVQLKFGTGAEFDHIPIVVDAGLGTPETVLVAAHSDDAYMRPLASYGYIELRPIHIYDT